MDYSPEELLICVIARLLKGVDHVRGRTNENLALLTIEDNGIAGPQH